MVLTDSGKTIALLNGVTPIHSVTYAGTDVQAGKSINVASDGTLSVESTNQYGLGDYGTPAGNTVTIGTHSYPSIQSAIDAASPSDIINVGAGTYAESVTVDKSVTVTGAGDSTIIAPATDSNGFLVTATNVTIQNLKITLQTSGADAQAIRLQAATSTTISGNTIRNNGE
jgi:hypothetical protein